MNPRMEQKSDKKREAPECREALAIARDRWRSLSVRLGGLPPGLGTPYTGARDQGRWSSPKPSSRTDSSCLRGRSFLCSRDNLEER